MSRGKTGAMGDDWRDDDSWDDCRDDWWLEAMKSHPVLTLLGTAAAIALFIYIGHFFESSGAVTYHGTTTYHSHRCTCRR